MDEEIGNEENEVEEEGEREGDDDDQEEKEGKGEKGKEEKKEEQILASPFLCCGHCGSCFRHARYDGCLNVHEHH